MNDTLPQEVAEAMAVFAGEAACTCHEAYTSRGMKDPQCNHDLAEYVETIRAHLRRLAEENARLKARIAEAPTVTLEFSITGGWWAEAGKGCPRIPQVLNGKRVRLVEDGERE